MQSHSLLIIVGGYMMDKITFTLIRWASARKMKNINKFCWKWLKLLKSTLRVPVARSGWKAFHSFSYYRYNTSPKGKSPSNSYCDNRSFSSSINLFHCTYSAWPDWKLGWENRFHSIGIMRLLRWWWWMIIQKKMNQLGTVSC